MSGTAALSLPIIDAHAHLRPAPGEADKLLAAMDAFGIEKTIVVAGGTLPPAVLSARFSAGEPIDLEIDNAAVRDACLPSAGRILPFFFANPIQGARAYQDAARDFFGLKLGPIVHGVPLSDARIHELIEVAEAIGHPVYLHCLPREGFNVADLVRLADAHPRAQIIMGHGGVGQADFGGISAIATRDNLHFEVSGTFSMTVRFARKTLGAGRVIFGSEYPLQDQRVELGKMEVLDLSVEDYRRIMRENILELIGTSLGTH